MMYIHLNLPKTEIKNPSKYQQTCICALSNVLLLLDVYQQVTFSKYVLDNVLDTLSHLSLTTAL